MLTVTSAMAAPNKEKEFKGNVSDKVALCTVFFQSPAWPGLFKNFGQCVKIFKEIYH
jgi:hypothetical protein